MVYKGNTTYINMLKDDIINGVVTKR